MLRDALRRMAVELGSCDDALLRRLKAALTARPLQRQDMVVRLEQALRLDADCRQGPFGLFGGCRVRFSSVFARGKALAHPFSLAFRASGQVRVRRLRCSDDLAFV